MSCVTCCAVLLEPQLLDIMIVQFRNEKVSNHGSIPITIDCNVVAFIVFEEVRTNDSLQPIKRTKQINHYNSVFTAEALVICQALDDLVEFNPPTGQNGFFCPTREASKMDCTDFSAFK
ncbi:hypothetical protein TNCV_4767901 [Trichonephila clavipes]|nr:hypothetical protein TNCV_4767901 [Trichonephila clavipes]